MFAETFHKKVHSAQFSKSVLAVIWDYYYFCVCVLALLFVCSFTFVTKRKFVKDSQRLAHNNLIFNAFFERFYDVFANSRWDFFFVDEFDFNQFQWDNGRSASVFPNTFVCYFEASPRFQDNNISFLCCCY